MKIAPAVILREFGRVVQAGRSWPAVGGAAELVRRIEAALPPHRPIVGFRPGCAIMSDRFPNRLQLAKSLTCRRASHDAGTRRSRIGGDAELRAEVAALLADSDGDRQLSPAAGLLGGREHAVRRHDSQAAFRVGRRN
jgi:hypothetical protein